MNSKSKFSIVIPCYRCADSLTELNLRLQKTLTKITEDFEIIFVNDGSPSNDWEIIRQISFQFSNVVGVNLSRNFGQHYAISAGLDFVSGDWVVVMDGDLQDDPEGILLLYNKALEGFDVVWARRHLRKDSFLKTIRSKIFFKVFDYLANTKTDPATNTFCICSKVVIENYKKLGEQNRAFTLFIKWLGFNQTKIDINHSKRYAGSSSYTFSKLLSLSINYIVIYSNKPLMISIALGFFIAACSFLYGSDLIFNKIVHSITLNGWASIMVSIYFMGGVVLASIGVLGLYVGKVFDEVKKRPHYLVKEVIGVQ